MANNKDISKDVILVVSKKINKSLRRQITMKYVENLRDRIVTRSRVGIGVNEESGRGERFPKLSKPYINRRKGAKSITSRNKIDRNRRKVARAERKKGNEVTVDLSSETTPSKSNITATGQLLKSLTVVKLKLRNAWGFRITMGDRRGRDLFGRPSKIGNKKLTEYLKDQGRHFFAFTKSQRNKINKEIRKFIINGLK